MKDRYRDKLMEEEEHNHHHHHLHSKVEIKDKP
jgi:hypothetical protein